MTQDLREYAELHGFDRDHDEPADEKPAPEQPLAKCYNCDEDCPPEQLSLYHGEPVCPACFDKLYFNGKEKNLAFNL